MDRGRKNDLNQLNETGANGERAILEGQWEKTGQKLPITGKRKGELSISLKKNNNRYCEIGEFKEKHIRCMKRGKKEERNSTGGINKAPWHETGRAAGKVQRYCNTSPAQGRKNKGKRKDEKA